MALEYQLTVRTTAPPPVATTFLGAKDNVCNASLCKEKNEKPLVSHPQTLKE